MTRPFKEIKINSITAWALFDTGTTYSYILNRILPAGSKKVKVRPPKKVVLGDQEIIIDELAILEAELNGHTFLLSCKPVDYLGKDEHDREIEVIVGAVNMEGALMVIDIKTGEIKFIEQLTEF